MDHQPETTPEILARIEASPARRWLAVGMLWLLAVLLLGTAIQSPPTDRLLLLFLAGVGIVAILMAVALYRATARSLVLTRDALWEDGGDLVARMDNIRSVDRGFMAFKPSNGFVLTLTKPEARAWRPGLWWRLGKRVGVGGVTPGSQAKSMADLILIALRERDGQDGRL
ncbi:hypothetical protein [Mesobacterium pallidum]|uniref:hypothetical protein n=1 Tax=Mesobacterium pallidum TaxID=2872037 RepID=UPI001EE1E4B6|nr:hypothetical protein [Mesobacterium pallidum]